MSTTTPASSTPSPPGTPARPAVVHPSRADVEKIVPGLLDWLASEGRDVDAELAELIAPRWMTPPPSTRERAAGVHFDLADVVRFVLMARRLRHVKGRDFYGKPVELDLWQLVYVVGPVLGWKQADGLRYYSEAFLEVPRKNGKSTLCAALALYLLTADKEPGAEIVSAAKDKDQARAVFDVAARMAERSPALSKRLDVLRRSGIITFERTGSTYKVISSDKGGDRKHGLNLHGGIVDELHVVTDRELIGTLETSTGSRAQPLIVYITTSGIESESPVWMEKRSTVIAAAEKVSPAGAVWGCIYAADPAVARDGRWSEEEVWRGANPGYGKSLRPAYIRKEAAKAARSGAALNRFLRLHLDVPQDSLSAWLDVGTYDRSASLVDEEDLEGARCYGGLDLASNLDLAAFVLVFPDPEDRIVDVVARFWTPADTMVRRSTDDGANYPEWARDGFLTATPGETINLDTVEADLIALRDRFDIRSVGYDPWGSLQLRQHLEDAGLDIFPIRQGFASLSPPMRLLETLVYERRFRHGGHPVLRFCVSNTTAVNDPAGNVKPDRKRSRSRIDGVLGSLMALSEWQRDVARGSSAYEDEDRDLVIVGA